ncbi:hypothetical protein PAMA_003864 [Pampus argenteus]
MVILSSWESRVQDQLTPKFPIKHKNKTSAFMQGSQFYAESCPAFSPFNLQGVWVDGGLIHGERGLEMKYVLGGYDCPTAVYLIPSSRVARMWPSSRLLPANNAIEYAMMVDDLLKHLLVLEYSNEACSCLAASPWCGQSRRPIVAKPLIERSNGSGFG